MESLNPIQQLADYVKKNLERGYTVDSLRFSLVEQGYSRISVDKAIEIANKQIAALIPPIKEKPQITYRIIDEKGVVNVIESEKKSFWKKLFGN